jgi:GDPmannose 4,6-dehydratase
MKKTIITGINGQDGSYLAELLLSKGYEVHGTLKRNSVSENQTSRLDNVYEDVILHYADMTDLSSLIRVIQEVKPSEIYNLASDSGDSGLGLINLL